MASIFGNKKTAKTIPLHEDIKQMQAHFEDFKFNQNSLVKESTAFLDTSKEYEKKLGVSKHQLN
jgi:hypothetical protein